MRKTLKILGFLVLGLVALVVVAVVAVALFVDAETFKGPITERVEAQTGRSLAIDGELDISVFPWLGVEAGQVRIGNAKGFGPEPFASVERMQVRAKLLPLILERALEVDTVVLDGAALRLAVDKSGRNNWSDLAGAPAEAPAEKPEPGAKAVGGLALGGIELRDASVQFVDRQAGRELTAEQVGLTVGAVQPGEPFDVHLEGRFQSNEPALAATLEVASRVKPDTAFNQLALEDLTVEVEARGEGLPAPVTASLEAQVTAALQQETATVRELTLSVAEVVAKGGFEGKRVLSKPQVTGELTIESFSPRKLLKRLGQSVPETADPKVLSEAQAGFKVAASTNAVALTGLTVTLDETELQGELRVTDLVRQAIRFELAADALDLDRYLPPEQEAPAETPTEAAAGAAMLPIDTLRALNLDGRLQVGELKAFGLRSQDVTVSVSAKDGMVRVAPSEAKLYEGRYEGQVQIDARSATPVLSLDERLEGVLLGPLLADALGKDRLTGSGMVDAELTAKGAEPAALRRTLNGKLAFEIRDGAVKGINIAQLIRQAQARLQGQGQSAEPGPKQTDFTSLTATATVRDGVIHNKDLAGRSPLLRVEGQGQVDLVKEQMDYRLKTVIVGTLEGQGGKELASLKGVPIPLRIKGPFQDPSVSVDLESVVKDRLKKELSKELEKRLDKKGDTEGEGSDKPLERELEKGLRNLFR